MKKFDVLRLPLMTKEGGWVGTPSDQWNIVLDKAGMLKIGSKNESHVLPFGNLLAVEVGGEEQVTSVGKTMGRMALTGVGAALFSQGRSGGVGAGLLDLSIRG